MRKYLIIFCLVFEISCKEETKLLKEIKDGKHVEYSVLDNKMNGIYLEYDSSGMVKYFSQTKDGFYNGNYVSYYENGTIMASGTIINAKQNGYKFSYYPNGTLMSKVKYKLDSLVEESYFYASNGMLSKAIDYRIDHGFEVNYDTIKGGLLSTYGVDHEYMRIDENGHIKERILFPKIPNCKLTIYIKSDEEDKQFEYVNPSDIEVNYKKEIFVTSVIEDKLGNKVSRVVKLAKSPH